MNETAAYHVDTQHRHLTLGIARYDKVGAGLNLNSIWFDWLYNIIYNIRNLGQSPTWVRPTS